MEIPYDIGEIVQAFEAQATDGHYQKLRKYCLHHEIPDKHLFEILDLYYRTDSTPTQ